MPDMNSFIDKGQLQISAVSAEGNVPIDDATIEISPTGEPENVIEQLTTDMQRIDSRSDHTQTVADDEADNKSRHINQAEAV